MFALITEVPTEALPDKVYLCVDFSQGSVYTTYIENTLKSFNNVHIVIQHEIDDMIDIYLSDFKSEAVKPLQIIWENPPTPHDWQMLGDTIIAIRHNHSRDIYQTGG